MNLFWTVQVKDVFWIDSFSLMNILIISKYSSGDISPMIIHADITVASESMYDVLMQLVSTVKPELRKRLYIHVYHIYSILFFSRFKPSWHHCLFVWAGQLSWCCWSIEVIHCLECHWWFMLPYHLLIASDLLPTCLVRHSSVFICLKSSDVHPCNLSASHDLHRNICHSSQRPNILINLFQICGILIGQEDCQKWRMSINTHWHVSIDGLLKCNDMLDQSTTAQIYMNTHKAFGMDVHTQNMPFCSAQSRQVSQCW